MRFDIADEIDIKLGIADNFCGLVNFFLAFHLFRTDIQQSDAGFFNPQRMLGDNIAHKGKFGQINGIAFSIGAEVKHNIFAALMGHYADNGRTMNALNGFQRQFGDSHQSTGIAGRDNGFRLAFADGINCHIHAGVAVADNLRGFVLIAHDFSCVAHFANLFEIGISIKDRKHFAFITEQQKADVGIFFSGNSKPLNDDSGGIVSPHGVY